MARVLLAALAALLLAAPAAGAQTRYSLVHGCYALQGPSGKFAAKSGSGYAVTAATANAGEPLRMQATTLGQYLFYGKAGDFVATDATGAVVPGSTPDSSGDWKVAERGDAFTIVLASTGKALSVASDGTLQLADAPSAFRFVKTDGCATFPEAEVNVTGKPYTGAAPWADTRGFIDPHFHWMAFEFLGGDAHCGRPWSPYGITVALVDCPDHQPNGAGAVLENVLTTGSPVGTHDTHGWPSFLGWPRPESLTHEGSYYRWVERMWRAGLRLTTVLFVDNAVLCEVYPIKRNSCDEMDSIRLQQRDLHQMQDYIDAQNGGPGKGWLRIVTSPWQARKVINAGKLAVIEGIESSRLFECRELRGTAGCTDKSIDAGLDEMYRLGVRQMEIVNKFDNALTGVAGDGGTTGLIVNNGNKIETGHYWRMQTCQNLPDDVHDNTQPTAPSQVEEDPVFAGVVANYLPTGETPVYPPGPHCNLAGLTPLGAHLIGRMVDKHMIFDPDHMSVKARMSALDLLEKRQYSGVISSHSWSTPDAYPRIYRLGGVITPITGRSEGFVQEWKRLKPQAAPRFYWGFGYGSDINGLHSEPPARNPKDPVTYPFKTFDGGSTVDRERTGTRVWDVNKDGVAQYGLLADWIEDLRHVGGDQIVDDMARGSEAYLQMWERATGVRGGGCLDSVSDAKLRKGMTATQAVKAAGQPETRGAREFTWCVDRGRTLVARLGRSGRIRSLSAH